MSYNPATGYSNAISTQRTVAYAAAVTSPALDLQPDMLDPESLLAFFEMKMGDARGNLNALIARQEAGNKRITLLQNVEGKLAACPDGIKPGDPGWDAFVASAKEAVVALGANSKEGQEIQALIDAGTKPTIVDQKFDNQAEAFAAAEKAGSVPDPATVKVTGPTGLSENKPGWTVKVPSGAPNGFSKEDVQKLVAQMKTCREGMQSDQQIQMIKVQQCVEQCSQITNLASNILRKVNDMMMAPINNMRG